jgi:hypothetical protein
MSADYIKQNFHQYVKNAGKIGTSINYQILTKSSKRRISLELALGCTISPNAELLSKPLLHKEVYGFEYIPSEDDIRINKLIEDTNKFIQEQINNFLY